MPLFPLATLAVAVARKSLARAIWKRGAWNRSLGVGEEQIQCGQFRRRSIIAVLQLSLSFLLHDSGASERGQQRCTPIIVVSSPVLVISKSGPGSVVFVMVCGQVRSA
jgi:hypothetical protein